jgi:REP element-mobilizing transposase RayT
MARAIAVGCAHHITQRGNNRQDVFMVDDDREVYLQILAEQAGRYGLEILGYCLMTNHVHLIAVPHAEDSLAKGIGRTHFRYSQYINRFHKRSGHLWQGRFYGILGSKLHISQSGSPTPKPLFRAIGLGWNGSEELVLTRSHKATKAGRGSSRSCPCHPLTR